ncbi:MAG: hypothetical protein ACREU6_10685, partial [Steroidobacteraceae bacterium]
PYFAKTGADGTGVLKGVERGDYRLGVWYPASQFDPHVEQIHVADTVERREVRLDTANSPLPGVIARAHAGH